MKASVLKSDFIEMVSACLNDGVASSKSLIFHQSREMCCAG